MITMRIKGGLGNQLFQYAAAYALSKRLHQPFRFNPALSTGMTAREYKLPELRVDVTDVVRDQELPRKIRFFRSRYVNKACRMMNWSKHQCGETLYWLETGDEWQPDFLTIEAPDLYVDGYFQSEDYFRQHREALLKQFQQRYEPEPAYLEALERIHGCESTAVHVRRSDFVKDRNPFHYLLSEQYYRRAVEYICTHVKDPVFFWFSDDADWVRQHIGDRPNFVYLNIRTAHGEIDDLMLMKNCRHIITANSTFSWWAAWLNEHEDAIRVTPAKPFGMEGMIPKGWVKVATE